jgi:hypothetical protein
MWEAANVNAGVGLKIQQMLREMLDAAVDHGYKLSFESD